MTCAHRRWHGRVALALALLLPLVFALGLLARRPVPVMSSDAVSWAVGANQPNVR